MTSTLAKFLWLLGREAAALRLILPQGDMLLSRDHDLPLDTLEAAAASSESLRVDPWVRLGDDRALAAVWTHAADPDVALSALPDALRPQLLVRTAVGGVLIWLVRPPYPEHPAEDGPAPGTLLTEIALALETIPAGVDDALPVPAREDELQILVADPTHSRTDTRELWAWVHARADHVRSAAAHAEEETSQAKRAAEDEPQAPPGPGIAAPSTGDVEEAETGEEDAPGDGGLPAASNGRAEMPDAAAADDAGPDAVPPAPLSDTTISDSEHAAQPIAVDQIPVPSRPSSAAVDAQAPERQLRALLTATAEAARLSEDALMGTALVAYAMRILGTEATFALLGVRMTWERPDGLYGLGENGWMKLIARGGGTP